MVINYISNGQDTIICLIVGTANVKVKLDLPNYVTNANLRKWNRS